VILYDYQTEKVRNKVRKNLKKIGMHVQWSVFESEEEIKKIEKILFEEEGEYRIAVFKVKSKSEILKIGKNWETIKTLY